MNREAMYGGAAGGGKTEALLTGALQFVDVPGYSALLLRRSYGDLNLPDAIMDRAHSWLRGTKAHWNGKDYVYTFPSGAKLQFGYLKADTDRYRYQGAQLQFIGFDELTQFTEIQYRYLFSRLRRLKNTNIPIRMRSATNPGGVGHSWVKRRFIDEGHSYKRIFIPARLIHNPYLDRESYEESLSELDPITRAQLLAGDWTAKQTGGKFRSEWFTIVETYPRNGFAVRYWDLAATEPKDGSDPDYTVGCLAMTDGKDFYIIDIKRIRGTPSKVESLITRTARQDYVQQMNGDFKYVDIWMEEEPGASGKIIIDYYTTLLLGYSFKGSRSTGSKEIRANPVSSLAQQGHVYLVRGTWITDFFDEVEAFPFGSHDDQVDAMSGALEKLARLPAGEIQIEFAKRPM